LENTGQAVASVVVQTQPDKSEPLMAIRVPVGLYLPAGLNLQIDNGKTQSVPLQTCDLQGCYSEMPLNSNFLAALKSGKRLSISCKNQAKTDALLPLPLDGFAEAFQKIE
jgi:invasion protein IalB